MNNAFLKSFQVLSDVYQNRAFSGIALNKALRYCSTKDKALITKIVYGVLDSNIRLEYIISKYIRKMPKDATLICLKIGVYCLENLSIPTYAVVNDAAELSKFSEDRRIVGFVNATLKNIAATIEEFDDYPQDEIERLSVQYSYPEWALRKLVKDYGLEIAKKIVCFPLEERATVRISKQISPLFFEQHGCDVESTLFDDAIYVKGKLPDFNDCFTTQSLSSMAISRICANGLGESFLDCCSAPGGKAIYVKQLCGSANVVACDIHEHRVELIKQYAARMGVDIETHCLDMSVLYQPFVNVFDTVLCDAPCSGFGVLNNHPDIKLFRENKDISELMKLQYAILSNCANYVKVGGRLIYSTCTVFDNENGQNIRKFLKEHTNFVYDKIALPQFELANNQPYYQFLPYKDGVQGFFVAVLKRTE